MNEMSIRTDLAVESREIYQNDNVEIEGVKLEESSIENIKITEMCIENEAGENAMGKPQGTYITLESESFCNGSEKELSNAVEVLSQYINKIIQNLKVKKNKILIVGLGNVHATPDALGPLTIDKINMWNEKICCIIPGVMAKTGMESLEIVKGVVSEIKPDVVIAIDSLAARYARRLNKTIQLSDTGINPGSGVGNHRKGINATTIGIPVVSIGIPTVIEVSTIVKDIMNKLIHLFEINENFRQLTENERMQFVREITEPEVGILYVTAKDIDENIRYMSDILAMAINNAF